jgi:hypothetical protein
MFGERLGADLGGLTFNNFTVSASAGFTAATVGLGAFSTVTPTNVNLLFQLQPPALGRATCCSATG